jgi:hypothetical protein
MRGRDGSLSEEKQEQKLQEFKAKLAEWMVAFPRRHPFSLCTDKMGLTPEHVERWRLRDPDIEAIFVRAGPRPEEVAVALDKPKVKPFMTGFDFNGRFRREFLESGILGKLKELVGQLDLTRQGDGAFGPDVKILLDVFRLPAVVAAFAKESAVVTKQAELHDPGLRMMSPEQIEEETDNAIRDGERIAEEMRSRAAISRTIAKESNGTG